ncbi:MAG: ABC transporter ATP-binding protein [Candidatus Latescibacteria bacterium]|nr:ABC transporter ATP-binding protein [Candidatus Latescibacterota bacterium]
MSWNLFQPFWVYLRPYHRRILLSLVLLTGAQIVSTIIPLALKWAIDAAQVGVEASRQTGQTAATAAALHDVTRYAGLILSLALVQMGLSMGMRWGLNSTARFVEYDIRKRYFGHLLTLSLSYFQRTPTGDLMARATNDLQAVRMFLDFGVRMIFTAMLAFGLSLTVMATIDWRLALYALLPMPVLALVMNRIAAKIHHGFRAVQEQFSAITARVQENLSGIRVVKAYVQRTAEIETFRKLNEEYLHKNRALIHIQSLFFPFMFLISGASLAIVLWIGGGQIIRHELTLGEFVAFNTYLTRLVFPMITLGWMIDRYQRGTASMSRINEVLRAQPDIQDASHPATPARIRGEIEFRRVSFAYNGTPVLQDITLRIPAGSTLAVVGRVGAGKTTLARLIPRLIEATQGQVLIDGVPVEQIALQTLRAAIGYVPQDTFLFSATLRENIALGVENAPDTEAAWATEVAQLSNDVSDFPQGLETMMGERGVTLSGGQKQRTALARAVIRRPPVLILDDAMASVDTHTEDEILKRLRDVMAERTTILIAHRVSTVKEADQIVVLDEGHIVEQGTHAELVALGGLYADMYKQQQLTDELSEL